MVAYNGKKMKKGKGDSNSTAKETIKPVKYKRKKKK